MIKTSWFAFAHAIGYWLRLTITSKNGTEHTGDINLTLNDMKQLRSVLDEQIAWAEEAQAKMEQYREQEKAH